MKWNKLLDKIPKLTHKEFIKLLIILIIAGVVIFRTCSIKTKWFEIDSGSTIKVEKKK